MPSAMGLELAPCLRCNPLAPSICPHLHIRVKYDSFGGETHSSSVGMTDSVLGCHARLNPQSIQSGSLFSHSAHPVSSSSVVLYSRTVACSPPLCQLPGDLGTAEKNVLLLCSCTGHVILPSFQKYRFKQYQFTFTDDMVIFWEDKREKYQLPFKLVDCVNVLNAILQNHN